MECTLVTLICLMLVSILVTSGIKPVEAPEPVITLYAVLDATEPYIGWGAGYHDIMKEVQKELLKIGIDLKLTYWDSGTIWDTCWESYWDVGSDVNVPSKGWDLTTGEQWLYLTGLTWMGAFVYKEALGPPGNIEPWLNLKADKIYHMAEAELDPQKRRELLIKWQELYMHDAAMINMFYTRQYEVQPKWFYGYDYSACYGDMRWNSRLEETSPDATLTFCIDETMYAGVNPLFCETYGTEGFSAMTFDCLYAVTRYPYPPTYNSTLWNATNIEAFPYVMAPQVAAGMPVYSSDYRTVYVPIREGVDWVWPGTMADTGYDLTAEDVKFTFEATIDEDTGATGYGDCAPVIESVEVPTNAELDATGLFGTGGEYNYTAKGRADEVFPWMGTDTVYFREPYVAKFNLYQPHADFELLIGVVWGASILPEFVLGPVGHSGLRTHETQYDPYLLPGTGPFLLRDGGFDPDVRATMDKNPYWWGTEMGYLATVDTFVLEMIVDPAQRKIGLAAGDFEICEAPIAPVSWFEGLDKDKFNVYMEPRANTGNIIRLNLNNKILANRYVRMAIAHAIPYADIPDILWQWGIKEDFPGYAVPLTEAIFPLTVLNGVPCYPTPAEQAVSPWLNPYGYDLDKAQYYMDLYVNQTNGDPTKGPVGDADQSGIVDFGDWWIWRANKGTSVTTPVWIYPEWPFTIDPDWNNDDNVDIINDESLWKGKYGTEYRP